jgi:hypothetical protein
MEKESDFVEMSCGFATMDLSEIQDDLKNKSNIEVTLDVHGGTLNSRVDIQEKDIMTRREGWKALKQWMGNNELHPRLTINVSTTPFDTSFINGADTKDKASCIAAMPANVTCAYHEVRAIHGMREIFAESVLFIEQPAQTGKVDALALNIFKQVCDQPDSFQVLCELWDEDWPAKTQPQSSFMRAPSNQEMDAFHAEKREAFKETVKRVWSAVICSKSSLPPLIFGVTDTIRLQLIRTMCIDGNPVQTLTSDGIGRLGMRDDFRTSAPTSFENGSRQDVHFSKSLVFAPFHTDEVSFDHAQHSADVYKDIEWTHASRNMRENTTQ